MVGVDNDDGRFFKKKIENFLYKMVNMSGGDAKFKIFQKEI